MSLLFIELNEVNLNYVQKYIDSGISLPNFQKLLESGFTITSSEIDYDTLEPWIQWPSVHTGLTFEQHKLFRLGDGARYEGSQLFEVVESHGYSVGVISAMNARNCLKQPAFFIPDPWTFTPTDGSWSSEAINKALKQAVNDNSEGKITIGSILRLALASFITLPFSSLYKLLKAMPWGLKRPWRKAIILDLFLFELFNSLSKKVPTDFAVLFLNAGAHIQHHYLLASPVVDSGSFTNPDWYVNKDDDPILEVYRYYDDMIGDLNSLSGSRFVIATGLTQVPYPDPCFYYRLRDHKSFLNSLGVKYHEVFPRMTRDFLIKFNTNANRDDCKHVLEKLSVSERILFGLIDVREKELFVTLDYSNELTPSSVLDENNFLGVNYPIYKDVVFVAIKNGGHNGRGFVLSHSDLPEPNFTCGNHVSKIYDYLLGFFPKKD